MVLEPELSNDEVSILISKSIIEKEEDGLNSSIFDHFVGVRPPLDMIQSWMEVR